MNIVVSKKSILPDQSTVTIMIEQIDESSLIDHNTFENIAHADAYEVALALRKNLPVRTMTFLMTMLTLPTIPTSYTATWARDITDWELTIVSKIAEGYTIPEIADMYNYSVADIGKAVMEIKAKLAARTNAEAVAIAVKLRLI